MKSKVKAAIIGGSGYTGLELIKILAGHSFAQIELITSNTYKGRLLSELIPNTREADLFFKATDEVSEMELAGIDVAFLCLPPHKSMKFVKDSLGKFNGAIIDIGSDFRIKDPGDYKLWYGQEHVLKDMIASFVYGLPETNYEKIKNAKYIANPGCYPTSVLLCLAPLMGLMAVNNKDIKESYSDGKPAGESLHKGAFQDADLMDASDAGMPGIEISDINIDSKSGVSGAGRKLKDDYLFCSINENFYAYSPILHRHIGEIEQELENISGKQIKVSFTPHLLPVNRGIFTSVYCKINFGDNISKCMCRYAVNVENTENKLKTQSEKIKELISSIFSWYYKNSYFVKFLGEKIPQLKDVVNTNYCHIGFAFDERTGTLKMFCAIDNLVKGAAGQAVQNMNIMFGFDQQEGLNG